MARRLSLPFESPMWIKSLVSSPKLRKTVCDKYFKRFDANGNGQLEEQELAALCAAVCSAMHTRPVQEKELHAALMKFDRSTSGGLTMSEFDKFFGHLLKTLLQEMEDPFGNEAAGSTDPNVPIARPESAAEAQDVFFWGQKVVFGQPPWVAKRLQADNLSAVSADVVLLSIVNMSAAVIWGPKTVDRTSSVASLQAVVAEAIIGLAAPSAVQLVHGEGLLDAKGTLASNGIGGDAATLTAIVTSASGMVAIALEALSACPNIENVDLRSSEYQMWLESDTGMKLVCESLQVLLHKVTPDNEDARKLCLQCLALPCPGMYEWDGRDEVYPDQLTFLAVQVLAKCSGRGDPDVKEVLLLWVSRLCDYQDTPLRPRRSGSDAVPQSTSEWTVGEVLKVLPALVAIGDRQVLNALDGQAMNMMCSGTMLCDQYFELDVWKMVACLRAYLGIVQECSSSHARLRPPKFLSSAKGSDKVDFESLLRLAAEEFGIVYTKIGGEQVDIDYAEGCEEYIYHRA